ncbi:hypothetical protein EI555_007313 [Monodon monoceros]|uniref:Uncharacterized protein n=1 Tax=Monodon monoceros TaxID=40151 RepID=A0A4U1EIE9_MONMO|nr:hypothetical protein EI555_007313 [Monodon monoceros]
MVMLAAEQPWRRHSCLQASQRSWGGPRRRRRLSSALVTGCPTEIECLHRLAFTLHQKGSIRSAGQILPSADSSLGELEGLAKEACAVCS